MSYKLEQDEFNLYLKELSKRYRIFSPVVKKGKGMHAETDVIGYGEVNALEEMCLTEKSYFSPKEIFYPIRETLFYFNGERIETPEIDMKPILIFLRPCDINGIEKLDMIFLKNGQEKDFYYLRRRELIKYMMIECTEGFDNCFCVSMKSNVTKQYDGVIRFLGNSLMLQLKDSDLKTDVLEGLKNIEFEPEFIQKNAIQVSIPDPDLLTTDVFNHVLWKEYTQRCIACGRCNTSCITCSCYTMQDVKLSDDQKISERRRIWAGCHVDGFTNMAGGHSFRTNNGERMRFKTMHKINDFYRRFDEHMCVGCGRCSDVCPEYISFSKCINRLSQIIDGGSQDE